MTWGFQAVNQNGQVLVSSETRNLHFVGKAYLDRVVKQTDSYGGIRQYAFRIACNITPMPFFTMPTSDYYAVSAVRSVAAGLWEIEVIRSGYGGQQPEVYVFCDPRGITGRPTTDYGMKVIMDDGTPSFDSRYRPLVVAGGVNVYPPSNPRVSGPGGLDPTECRSDGGPSLAPDNANTFAMPVLTDKPIYYYPSIAQAQREFSVYRSRRECVGFNVYGGCIGYGSQENWRSTYWAFYRGGIKHVGNTVFCGWIAVEYGCNWDYKRDNSFVGIGIGGSSGQGGVWPYSNETLNLFSTPIIAAKGARYD